MNPRSASCPPRVRVVLVALLLLGIGLQALLWSRQGVAGDQYAILTPAVRVLETGDLQPTTKGVSGGGRLPGALLQLLVAAPLAVWNDYRAPAIVIGLFHLAALALLAATLGRALGAPFFASYLAVFWLSPWRLYHSGFLWEPCYLVLPAAVHLWCCWRLRERARAPETIALAATLVLTAQLHPSFGVLVLATALLWWRGLVQVRLHTLAVGIALGAVPLWPTLRAWLAGELPQIVPGHSLDLTGLNVAVTNAVKALLYWVRLASPNVGRRLRQTVHVAADGPAEDLSPFLDLAAEPLVLLTLAAAALSAWASWRWFGGSGIRRDEQDPEGWTRRYAGLFLIAVVAAATISPVWIQGWHLVIALPAACLPMAVWIRDAWFGEGGKGLLPGIAPARTRRRALVVVFLLLQVLTTLIVGLGHPTYRPPDAADRARMPVRVAPLVPER